MAARIAQLATGLICPLVTPLKTGDVVDEGALDRLIEHVGTGADALIVNDVFWGEGLALSTDSRLDVASAVLEIVQGRWPVYITITSESRKATGELLARTEHFIERSDYRGGVCWVDYPIYYHSNRGLPQWFETMAQESGICFVLGNHAGLMETRKRPVEHKNIRTAVFKKIAHVDQVQGMVFSGSLKRSMNYRKAVRHREDFKIYDSDEKAFLERPSADGVVAGGANLLPEAWRGITRSSLNRYDVQQQYPDHTTQILEAAGMLMAFHTLYSQNPAAMMKRMLHVAGVLPNAHIASATEPTTAEQNLAVEEICKEYDLA
jgi:dihydrodipicolinate synthase/N-acetylneuraminate lyase